MNVEYMKHALELAKKGTGYVNPNPLVGAVIVKNNKIIGEGYHHIYGGDHAEIDAFKNSTEDVTGATMYVTLEPCSHYGKTPPCAKAIVEKGIKKVIIGLKDPNPLVSGKGIKILQENGIDVVTGVLEAEGKKLNEIFLKYITSRLPFCIMKTAMTLDGKIASYTGDSKWITNEASRNFVHKIRNKVSGIMVGIGTILTDNPFLTTRCENGSDAARIIIDSSAKIPLDANVLTLKSKAKTIIATTEQADEKKLKALEAIGTDIIVTPLKESKVNLSYLMKVLGENKIDSILLEGGSTLNYSALDEGIIDKVYTFISPKFIGGAISKTPIGGQGIPLIKDAIKLKNISIHNFQEDIMIEGYLRKSH